MRIGARAAAPVACDESESVVSQAPRSQPSRVDPVPDLVVNGEPCAVAEGCTLQGLVEQLGLDRRRIAIAVNREIVARSAFEQTTLAAGDRVEILEAVGGG